MVNYFLSVLRKFRTQRNLNTRINKIQFDKNSILFGCVLEGYNKLNQTKLTNCYVGLGTYFSIGTSLTQVKIGRFCSIGRNVKNGFNLHPTKEFVSTHPAFFSTKKQAGFTFVNEDIFKEYNYADDKKKWQVIIGNDVWIGNNVSIMPGITIGNGAVIGANALVTKNVPSFAIVGGVPAKVIRYRFSDEEINFLNELNWWNKDMNWIQKNSIYFNDIIKFRAETQNKK